MAAIKYTAKENKYITEPGIYSGEVTEVKPELKNGDDIFKITLTTPDGLTQPDTLRFTEKSAWYVAKFLRKAGLTDDVEEGDNVEVEADNILGAKLKFRAGLRSYKDAAGVDKQIMEVKDYFHFDEEPEAPKKAAPAGETKAPKKLGKPATATGEPNY